MRRRRRAAPAEAAQLEAANKSRRLFLLVALLATATAIQPANGQQEPSVGLKLDPTTNGYSGLTFTFEPKLDKRVEWSVHFEHWLSIMQHSSSILYDALNGRAHLQEVRVLIPFKWRNLSLPVFQHKPGSPIMQNRRLLYSAADVLVGPDGKCEPLRRLSISLGFAGLELRVRQMILHTNNRSKWFCGRRNTDSVRVSQRRRRRRRR